MKINVTIIQETAKALLVQDSEGRQAWVQRRWFVDGQVNAKTFEKGVEWLGQRASAKQEADEFKNSLHSIGKIVRESDSGKAVAVKANWTEESTDQTGTKLAWFPKSQVRDGKAPGWLIIAKCKDIGAQIYRAGGSFRVSIADHGFYV